MTIKIGPRLRELRLASKLKSSLVALELDCDRKLLLRVEAGLRKPDYKLIKKACEFYGIEDKALYLSGYEFNDYVRDVKKRFKEILASGKYKMKHYEMVRTKGDGTEIVVQGMFTKEEVKYMRTKKFKQRVINKHGIMSLQ